VSARLRRRLLTALFVMGVIVFLSAAFGSIVAEDVGIELSREVEVVRTERILTKAGWITVGSLILGYIILVVSLMFLVSEDPLDCP